MQHARDARTTYFGVGFNDGTLKPFPVAADTTYSLADAVKAYRAVIRGSREPTRFRNGWTRPL